MDSGQNSSLGGLYFGVLCDAVDLLLGHFDCSRPAERRHAGLVFATAKPDFPSPAGTVHHLHDGVFDALMFHNTPPQVQRLRRSLAALKSRNLPLVVKAANGVKPN